MSLEHHSNHRLRFDQQVENSRQYVIPFLQQTTRVAKGTRVLEIGCGEGGVLKPFAELGCECFGADLNEIRIELGQEFLQDEIQRGTIRLKYQNVQDEEFVATYENYFDVILLKDVIEHIPNQESFIPFMKTLLKPGGDIFFGFPPWYMPFGGHQQLVKHKIGSKLPYYHLLPMPIYMQVLKWMGESGGDLQELRDIKETGISIERFERIVNQSGYSIVGKQWYLINPIYKYKFGLQPRKQNWLFGVLPFVRNFLTTCAYYTIRKN